LPSLDLGVGGFRELVLRHQTMVYSIALRMVGDAGLAEEIAQDVFFELYKTQPRLEGEDHLRNWLRRVSAHRSIDQVRRAKVRPGWTAEEYEEEMPAAFCTDEMNVEMAARLEELLMTLPESQRAVVTLRYMEEMEPMEIAAMLEMPVATVRSHLQRALHLARQKAAVLLREYVRE